MRLLAIRPARRCALCHADLAPDEGRACPGCATRGHDACLDEVGCPTLGCSCRTPVLRCPPGRSIPADLLDVFLPRSGWARLALTIVGLLAPLGWAELTSWPPCGHDCSTDRRNRIRGDMRAISDGLDLFKIDTGRYPERMDQLRDRPAGARKWNGPYLKEHPPRDPWGTEYLYLPASHQIVSLGADGFAGGEEEAADLSSLTIDR